MAKQFIISAMEEVFGEYILNMSKENLKIAALRGKIKLEQVQLDGDLIGSHVLGAFGLAGFGILSCYANSVQISVPWNQLETEPTKFEVRGLHLVCVPLTPSTAHQMYGAGTALDPRCTLRTKAKRLLLARLERNYWNGMIPDEGPPLKRVQRAAKEVEKNLKKRKNAGKKNNDEMEQAFDNILYNLGDESVTYSPDELPELPRDWKVKLREKVLRNMEASIHDMHIRVEMAQGNLEERADHDGIGPSLEDHSFALGFTLGSFVVRTANENWEIGSYDKRNPVDGSAMSSEKGHLGPNEYIVKNNKIGVFSKLSMYWDSEPPVLLAETDLLRGNYKKLSSDKLQRKIGAAMDAMRYSQEPGKEIRQSLVLPVPENIQTDLPHEYIVDSMEAEIRSRSSDRTQPGPISCSADVMPFYLTFNIRPHQYSQYQQLQKAMKSQQRLDTMLRQRPTESPIANPRAWWKYAISCITARPTCRPWEDIKKIVRHRARYIDLVVKKNKHSKDGSGYHAGLSDSESAELLELENLLPSEALLAFHLVALRKVYYQQSAEGRFNDFSKSSAKSKPRDQRMRGFSPFRRASSKRSSSYNELNDTLLVSETLPSIRSSDHNMGSSESGGKLSLLHAINLRLGKKKWFVHWKLHDVAVNVLLLSNQGNTIAELAVTTKGAIRSFGLGKRDFFFDITHFDVYHRDTKVLFPQSLDTVSHADTDENIFGSLSRDSGSFSDVRDLGVGTIDAGPDMITPSAFLGLPPHGVTFRIVAGKNFSAQNFSISAHPVTWMWSSSMFDGVADFFTTQAKKQNIELTEYIRNVATPLARKAQLALLSPSSGALFINASAPKVWLPVVSEDTEGGVFVDAGMLKLGGIKNQGESNMSWDVKATEIRVNFVKHSSRPWQGEGSQISWLPQFYELPSGPETSIVHPVNITISLANRLMGKEIQSSDWGDMSLEGVQVRYLNVSVSPVCLNLADAEVLARAFGRIYARGIQRVRSRQSLKSSQKNVDRLQGASSKNIADELQEEQIRVSTMPFLLSLDISVIEIVLEGHSKAISSADERSMHSHDTTKESTPPTRTYLVELRKILIERVRRMDYGRMSLSVSHASIVRLVNGPLHSPFLGHSYDLPSQNTILVRSKNATDKTLSHVITASVLHDGKSHLDEVELDIDSVVLRVTPTTLKDCAKAFKRIAELVQLVTKEMERKVHEQGRLARKKDQKGGHRHGLLASEIQNLAGRPMSPVISEVPTELTEVEKETDFTPLDSSILFRITLNASSLLVGRPISTSGESASSQLAGNVAVIQVSSNALIMFQSIENPDGTGSKTLHISVENLASLVNTGFVEVLSTEVPPMIGPTGIEFRVVYATENMGNVVSQDISTDFEKMKACLTPNDLSIMVTIWRTMLDRVRAFGSEESDSQSKTRASGTHPLRTIIRYQKKGTGIATSIRFEIQGLSFTLLRAYKSFCGAPEFLDFHIEFLKGQLEGCMSALSGELNAILSINFYNADINEWEYVAEPFPVTLSVDQMPNELVLTVSPGDSVQVNVTGLLLRDFAELYFELNRQRSGADSRESAIFAPSVLSTVGLRRATESRSVKVHNLTGLDIHVVPDSSAFDEQTGFVASGTLTLLEGPFDGLTLAEFQNHSLTLRIAESSKMLVGEREPVFDLPLKTPTEGGRLYLLNPTTYVYQTDYIEVLKLNGDGRASPDTVSTDAPFLVKAYYHAEPVVEWCMQNQRLRSNTSDLSSIPRGADLLSSNIWSPEDDPEELELAALSRDDSYFDSDGLERSGGAANENKAKFKSFWLRPYLKNDAPEWTDMTCTLQLARDRVMLPDNNWVWLNDWSVDVNGNLGESTDVDGWEYEADFETFAKTRRYYERGDACRRRRWTRTRMIIPPHLNDPNRIFRFVWETSSDEHGNLSITVRSNLRISNHTDLPLGFFVGSPSWGEDKFVGVARADEQINVPVILASAAYLRITKATGSPDETVPEESISSHRLMIIPSTHKGSTFVRASIDLKDVSRSTLNFVVEIRHNNGIIDIFVEPILRVVNLLPSTLECQMGEAIRNNDRRVIDPRAAIGKRKKKIANTETLKILPGKSDSSTAVNPSWKPHISFRVPGYRWSPWHRIVNRKANSSTWRPPSEIEEEHLFVNKDDADFADEFKSLVRFERIGKVGDPLYILMSVECGHTPTIRVYSQYWIVDKTGFGCRFAEGFSDILASVPDIETSRRSHLLPEEAKDPDIISDMRLAGHQWSIGMSGMSLYFSRREKIALAIERGAGTGKQTKKSCEVRSKWISPLDISNVIPKTAFNVDELNGPRRFELAISVTVCPGIFGRTKLITLLPRYQIVNLLHRALVVAQDGCLDFPTVIPSQSSLPFHWEQGNLDPKVRIGAPSSDERHNGAYDKCWTNGQFRIDRVGITSMRLPTDRLAQIPMVIQAEVRLASKDQPSAVVVVIWSATTKSNPLYILRNRTPFTVLCRQPLQDEHAEDEPDLTAACSPGRNMGDAFHCGSEMAPIIRSFLGMERIEEFVWVLKSDEATCFGFDDPEKAHILEWTCVVENTQQFDERHKAILEIDAMGSSSILGLPNGRLIRCQIGAEHSTKVIEFSLVTHFDSEGDLLTGEASPLQKRRHQYHRLLASEGILTDKKLLRNEDEEEAAFSLRIDMSGLYVSVVDNKDPTVHGREIMLGSLERVYLAFSQTREGYHEVELKLMSFQIDNHIQKSIHPVMVFCPRGDDYEPFLHMSAVRRIQPHSSTLAFRYVAIRLLDIELYLDRRTAETIAHFIEPLTLPQEEETEDHTNWLSILTNNMGVKFATPDRRMPRDIEMIATTANSGRIYFEQLHLHPVRLSLTFTQEWVEGSSGADSMMVFQFIRGMASIANAPLTFTSFVVGHVFEAPQALFRVILTHYSSQLTKQIFGILGSLAILGAPADFISNVGTGVRDFFYEPINGAVHGPRQFIEGLEAGTQSLARGVFVGVVRGAANMAEVLNSNLAGLTADEDFLDERKAHQRMLTDAMSRGKSNRSFSDSLYLAGASVARGIKSGALGIVEQPAHYASKHGPVGFLKGVGKAMVGVVVKPVVGVGDAAVLVMNHMSDATSLKQVLPKIPKRLRRALPSHSPDKPYRVRLLPYDERAAKAQKIVTGSESLDDVYIGHIDIPSHLIIASDQCLWAIDRRSREPWCVSWEEISHFSSMDGGVKVVVFSQTGLKTYVFHVDTRQEGIELHKLLSMHVDKMGNSSELNSSLLSAEPESFTRHQIPGIKARQTKHVFGSCNNNKQRLSNTVKDEVDLVEQCFKRVSKLGSDSETFFKTLDEEAWYLICSWGQIFSGLNSRRCIVAGVINGTGQALQIKTSTLVEGGSPCYSIPSNEYDSEQSILHAGGCILFFGWGVVPNLLQAGHVFMHLETNGFVSDLSDQKSRSTYAEAMPGYQVGFLEKSYDDSNWWAKFWLLVRAKN